MNRIDGKTALINILWPLGLVTAAGSVQYLFYIDQPIYALVALMILGGISLYLTPECNQLLARSRWRKAERFIPFLFWIVAIVLRLYRLEEMYIIDDLAARFLHTSLKILNGQPVFPCMTPFEYDESLTSWIYVPFIHLFGHSWGAVKTVSAVLNSMLVPIAWLCVRKQFSALAASFVAGLLVLSSYFNYCDPMISMSRFAFIAILLFLLVTYLDRALDSQKSLLWIAIVSILSVVPMYLHSTGRAAPVIVFFCGLYRIITAKKVLRMTMFWRFMAILSCSIICFTPFLAFVKNHPEYLAFKRRQIFGFHESYPFSWSGLWSNFISVLGNFNYRAIHHMHFSANAPLLRPVTATGVIGFLWLSPRMIKNRVVVYWYAVLVATVLPLTIVTPGHWRGLYFSAPVAFLTAGAGLFYAVIASQLALGVSRCLNRRALRKPVCWLLLGVCLSMVFCFRVSTYYSGKSAPPRTDLFTKLYYDMETEPDTPHYFSVTIPEMKSGYAMFELLGTAWFSEYGVLEYDPLRLMHSPHQGRALRSDLIGDKTIELVLRSSDGDRLRAIGRSFKETEVTKLEKSGLLILTINGD